MSNDSPPFAELHQGVYERLKAPLLTAAGNSPDLSYVAIQHIQLLLVRSPGLFENEYKFFYIKYVVAPTYLMHGLTRCQG